MWLDYSGHTNTRIVNENQGINHESKQQAPLHFGI